MGWFSISTDSVSVTEPGGHHSQGFHGYLHALLISCQALPSLRHLSQAPKLAMCLNDYDGNTQLKNNYFSLFKYNIFFPETNSASVTFSLLQNNFIVKFTDIAPKISCYLIKV